MAMGESMSTKVDRRTVDLAEYPGLVVIYLGMPGSRGLAGQARQARQARQESPDHRREYVLLKTDPMERTDP